MTTTGDDGFEERQEIAAPLLAPDEPSPVRYVNATSSGPFLLTADHAGNRIPQALGTLGLGESDRQRHIAWDIGIAGLANRLSERLDTPLIAQVYSRLVVDCNRDPAAPDALPERSDGTTVPGNAGIDAPARAARIAAIHVPYQAAIGAMIGTMTARGTPPVLVALHSFTPVMAGERRPWDVGVLHSGGDARFAQALIAALRRERLIVGDNAPYRMDETDHSVPRHAFTRGLLYAEIEVRQDLIATDAGQALWCGTLAQALDDALRGMGGRPNP